MMRMIEVVKLPEFQFADNQPWFAVIGPGKEIKHLCGDPNAAEQLRMREGPATHEVRQLRFEGSDD